MPFLQCLRSRTVEHSPAAEAWVIFPAFPARLESSFPFSKARRGREPALGEVEGSVRPTRVRIHRSQDLQVKIPHPLAENARRMGHP